MEPYDLKGRYVIADKGYDSDSFIKRLTERETMVVIASCRTAKHPRSIDRYIYMKRYLAENLFLKLKVHCRLSARFEKRAASLAAVPRLAAILIWIAGV